MDSVAFRLDRWKTGVKARRTGLFRTKVEGTEGKEGGGDDVVRCAAHAKKSDLWDEMVDI